MSRRQSQKEQRRQRILDAAEELIRESAGTEFLMTTLAERAGFSQATPYNLFGSKAGILFALLNRSVDEIFRDADLDNGETDPFERVLHAARVASGVFSADPGFYRPLYRYLLGVVDSEHRPAFMDRALVYWKRALAGAGTAGLFSPELTRDEMARGIVVYFLGTLDLWVQDELDDREFDAQIQYGVACLLLGIADDAARPALKGHLRRAKQRLPRRFTFSLAVTRNRTGESAA